MFADKSLRIWRRWRPRYWLLGGLLVLLVLLVLGLAVALIGYLPSRWGEQAPKSNSSTVKPLPPTPNSTCMPRIVESGYSVHGGLIDLGFIVNNPCAHTVVGNLYEVALFNAKGERVRTNYGGHLVVPVIRPGQTLGVGDQIYFDDGFEWSRLAISFTHSYAALEAAFTGWPRTASIRDFQFLRGENGSDYKIGGRIESDPKNAKLCDPRVHLVARDRTGRIVYGAAWDPYEELPEFTFKGWIPPGVDVAGTEAFVGLGRSILRPDGTVPFITCNS